MFKKFASVLDGVDGDSDGIGIIFTKNLIVKK